MKNILRAFRFKNIKMGKFKILKSKKVEWAIGKQNLSENDKINKNEIFKINVIAINHQLCQQK